MGNRPNRVFGPVRLALAIALTMLLAPAAAQGAILYDSTPSSLGMHPTVQDFETIHDDDDAEVADDFTVPPGQTWTLQRVFVDGRQPPPPGPNTTNIVNVALYSSAGALPAATSFYAMQLTSDAGTVYPDFDLALPGVAALGPGTYWFSAQARMNFDSNDQNVWFWGTTPTLRGNGALIAIRATASSRRASHSSRWLAASRV